MNHKAKTTALGTKIEGARSDRPHLTSRQRAILNEAYKGDDETISRIAYLLFAPHVEQGFRFDVYDLEALCSISPSFGARYLAERWRDIGMTIERANRIIDLGLDLFRLRGKDDRNSQAEATHPLPSRAVSRNV